MPFKGFNSILFDIDSIIDMEISYIKFMASKYKNNNLEYFDKNKIINTKDEDLEFYRMYGTTDLFKSVILDTSGFKSQYDKIFKLFIDRDIEDVLNFAHFTAMKDLINAYKKAGDGVIKTSIYCDNDVTRKFIQNIFSNIPIEIGRREEVCMEKYTRLICGNYKHILQYNLKEPKSILVLNFRENFIESNIKILRPELVISLGDIHNIEVISAYRTNNDNFKIEG